MERYALKEEFLPKYHIPECQWRRRKKDLLNHLENYFDFKIIKSSPIVIEIYEQYGEYQPLPRKVNVTNREEKLKDYEDFTIAALGKEFKPNSKARVARQAIAAFGYEKYGHTNDEAVTKRFVAPAFDEHGETEGPHIWVWYDSYLEPNPEVVEKWRSILRKWKIDAQDAANAFYKQEQGEDITKEKEAFQGAREEFHSIYGEYLVLVRNWRCKDF